MKPNTSVFPCFTGLKQKKRTFLVLFLSVMHCYGVLADPPLDPNKPLTIALVEKGTDVFYLSALVGGNPTELLFDTGSGYLALNQGLIKSLEDRGMASYQRSVRARLANGSVKDVPIYQVTALDLGNGCIIRNVDAAMLAGDTRNILGMNVLKMVDSFSVSLSSATLTLSGCNRA